MFTTEVSADATTVCSNPIPITNSSNDTLPLPVETFEAEIHYNYHIPTEDETAVIKQKIMKTEKFKETVKKDGQKKAEENLDTKLKIEADLMKEKNELGSEKIPFVKVGEHSAYFSTYTYEATSDGQCLTTKKDPINLFFYDVGHAERVASKLSQAGWNTTEWPWAYNQCAFVSSSAPPDNFEPSMMSVQSVQMVDGPESLRDHIRIFETPQSNTGGWEGRWSIGAVHHEAWDEFYYTHCLVPFHPQGSSFDEGEYAVWHNSLGYYPRYFFDGNNGDWILDSCNHWVGNDGVTVGIDMRSNYLVPGEWLYAGQSLYSNDGRFHFIYQYDGNLVLYQQGVGDIWSIKKSSPNPGWTIMQSDGNFVTYNSNGLSYWDSGTWGSGWVYLIVQNDGNVVIYNLFGTPIWATNTCCR